MAVLLLAACLVSCGKMLALEPEPDVPDTVEITGMFAGYSLGDYYHAVIIDDEGQMFTLWAPNPQTPGLDVFLFQHRGELVSVKAVERSVVLFEAGNQLITIAVDARTQEETYSQWFERISLEYGIETGADFHEVFGDPAVTEELVNELEYQ